MKLKTILSLLMLGTITASAQDSHKIIKATDSNEYEHYYYYNAQNQLFWETFGTTRNEYTYNEAGQKTGMNQYSWIPADADFKLMNTETYTYDADGNLSERVQVKNVGGAFEVTWKYVYSDYENGVATYYDEYKNGNIYYMYKQVSTFDANKNQTACTVYYADPDKYTNPTHATVEYKDKDYEYTKEYDANGNLIKENTGKISYEYSYADLGAAYSPANFKAANNGDGTVTLTWDAVAGADSYVVAYDLERDTINATNYSIKVGTGNRLFTVQTIAGGMLRNAVAPIEAKVVDAGNLPITDLAVGTIYETEEETESEEASKRTFYNIPLTWTLPQGHSEIKGFHVNYKSLTYGNTYRGENASNLTSYLLKVDPYEVVKYDEKGKITESVETEIYVTIIYASGESEKSNTITVNPYQIITPVSDIKVETPTASPAAYTISGVPASKDAKGIIISDGKKYIRK